MFDIATAQSVVPRELDAIIERAPGLTDQEWDTSIPWLPGWRVAELLDHVGRAANQQAEAFENLLEGRDDIPAYPNAEPGTRAEVTGQLKTGRDRFVGAVDRLDVGHLDTMTPLPFGLVPTPVAVQIAVLEYAYHRWDLEHALGNTSYALPTDVAPHGFEFLGGLLPMLAAGGTPPAGPLTFELRTPNGSLVLHHGPAGWQAGIDIPTGDRCVIEGAVGDLALYGMGRRTADDPALGVSGTQAPEATAFKSYFPGP